MNDSKNNKPFSKSELTSVSKNELKKGPEGKNVSSLRSKAFKTYSQKPAEISREWFLIDASTMPLGKLAVVIADKLMGKSKPTFTPHVDNGDYVVVINAKNLVVTGAKLEDKKYYHHSGYHGGLTELSLAEIIEKDPSIAITEAVKGMLPKNKLVDGRLSRLKVFSGAEHAHTAQTPKEIK